MRPLAAFNFAKGIRPAAANPDTGAGGSIGSELCRLIPRWSPKVLVLFEQNEFALYNVHRGCRCAARLAMGWRSRGDYDMALVRMRVRDFVLISSDKAVRPTNVMAATKRGAELIVRHYAHRTEAAGTGQRFRAVRLGNVPGSDASCLARNRKPGKAPPPRPLRPVDIAWPVPHKAKSYIVSDSLMALVSFDECRQAALVALQAAGVGSEAAQLQTDLLLDAELRGVPSHGFLRLERIIARVANGVADPHTRGLHSWCGDSFLSVDGRNGLGPVVAKHAADIAGARARQTGIAVAAIANNNHIGMLAWYAEALAEAGLVSIILTTSEALVHPFGGRVALLGTNPIAIGVPTATGPFVIDLATSLVSMGEIHDKAHRGVAIPEGWALDEQGNPTTDPNQAKKGAIAPFGGAKGYALGLAFELLVTALTGAALGRDVTGTLNADFACNKGDVFILIDPLSGQGAALSAYLDTIRLTPPAAGFEQVLIPGERGLALKAQRRAEGIPLADEVWITMQLLRDAASAGNRGR